MSYKIMIGVVGVVVGLIALIWFLYLALNGTSELIVTISDPTERGLAYIAAAIVFHAFFYGPIPERKS